MTSSIQPRIQRIQAAISQANLFEQEQGFARAAGQPRDCSFEIAGRTQVGYLGVNSLAEVTPPWFPKDAFQVKGRCQRPVSPMITLKSSSSSSSCSPQAKLDEHQVCPASSAKPQVAQPTALTQSPNLPPRLQSSVFGDVFQAVTTVTNELAQAKQTAGRSTMGCRPDCEPQPPHKASLPPASEAEQAAAQALAHSLSQSLETALPQPLENTPEQWLSNIRPIETVSPPVLPRSKSPELSSHHNSTNPMLPLELLQNIGQEVMAWQEALQEVHQHIQTLYQEGPILNGWLEKHSDAGIYQLCGLDATGESWRRPCHPEQLQSVGFAIGRYKKLRLLLGEKQRIEQRIKRLSESLTMLRLRLRAY